MADIRQYGDFACYYDRLMEDVDYGMWTSHIMDIINKYGIRHRDVLEMACGTGNIAVNIAKIGYDVTAFDLSEDMLTVASRKTSDGGVKVRFLCQDMREIHINQSFGIILCLCDSINYITDPSELLSVFKWVFDHLKKGGLFIFDINSSYKLRKIIGDNTFTYNEDDVAYIWDNYVRDDGIVEFYLTFFVKEGELYRRFDELHEEKAYEIKDIEDLLKAAGFSESGIHIDEAFKFKSPDPTCERINFTVMKP